MNLSASLAADAAAQQSTAQPVDMHPHAIVGLFHLGHRMSFQTQLFSDKRLYEHLGSVLSYSLAGNTKLNRCCGALQIPVRPQTQAFKQLQLPLHFSETNQKKIQTVSGKTVLTHHWVYARPLLSKT